MRLISSWPSCLYLCLFLCSATIVGCIDQITEEERMNSPLEYVATILGRSMEELQQLDHRPLPLAFVSGHYATYVVRDLTTGEVHEVTLDLTTGNPIDPVYLRQLDRQRAAEEGHKLTPELLDLVLRHPELNQVNVLVQFSPTAFDANSRDIDPGSEPHPLVESELRRLAITPSSQTFTAGFEADLTLSVEEIIHLASSSVIDSIELVTDPVIPDTMGE